MKYIGLILCAVFVCVSGYGGNVVKMHMTLDKVVAAMNGVRPYLHKSTDSDTEHSVLKSPSARLRAQAKEIEERDAAIDKFRAACDDLNDVMKEIEASK